jgi:hypothetical protein
MHPVKAIKRVDVGSFAAYGAILAALWTFIFGLFYWILGWIFGASSWWIDMNLGNWSAYTLATFGLLFLRAVFAAAGGAIAGAVVALVYNMVARTMGGLKINLE